MEDRYCFRCKDMAVIDPVALNHLPRILNKAASRLQEIGSDGVWWSGELVDELREYAILVESVAQDG